jgi:Paraquat-inducible protein A
VKPKNNPTNSFYPILKVLLVLFISAVLLFICYSGYKVRTLSNKQEGMKKDYMIINSISFGLLSVDEWRDNIISAAKTRIQNYHLTPEQNQALKKQIEQILNQVVNKAIFNIQKPSKNLGKKLEKAAFNIVVNPGKLHAEIPGYAALIVDELNKPESYTRLKNIAQIELDSLGSQTYDLSKNSEKILMDSIFQKYQVADKPSFETQSIAALEQIRKQTYYWAFGMLSGVILMLTIWWFARNVPGIHTPLYVMSIFSALMLMAVGLTSAVIQVDARISSMDFHMMGQIVGFKNQILFYQSKSIVEVMQILIQTAKIDTVIVGLMILIFCIFFPLLKLFSTGVYMVEKNRWAKNKTIHFFAFQATKWNMSDVLVLAILMTYIGFNGIVNSTLSDLNMHNETITSVTTNNTSVQPGFILFSGFVLYSITLSYILKNISHMREIIVVDKNS